MSNHSLLLFSIIFLISLPAHAYIGPGMAGGIIAAILGFIAAAVTSVTFFWNNIKSIIKNIFKKKKNKKNDDKVE